MTSSLKILIAVLSVLMLPALTASAHAAGPAPKPGWEWPLEPRPADLRSSVLRDFDPPDKPWLSGHRGVDLKTGSDGATVTSPAAGTVSFAGTVVDRPVITVDHGSGLKSSFEPVSSSLTVGDTVAPGETIGTVQPGHCSGTPCVHWGVRQADEYVDPLGFFIDLRPSILLPLLSTGLAAVHGQAVPRQTMAEIPVIARPVTSVLTSCVPS